MLSRFALPPLFRHIDVRGEQEPAVPLAVGLFEHLALAAAARAFVHDGEAVAVGRDDAGGGAVGGGELSVISCQKAKS